MPKTEETGGRSEHSEKPKKMGPEETIWKDLLDLAEIPEEDQEHMLAMARGRDLSLARLQRQQQQTIEALREFTKALQSLEKTFRSKFPG